MLKVELEQKVRDLEGTIEEIKSKVRDVATIAVDDNCDEALHYVAKLNEELNLGISQEGHISISIDIPVDLSLAYVQGELDNKDLTLIYKGREIAIYSVDELNKD